MIALVQLPRTDRPGSPLPIIHTQFTLLINIHQSIIGILSKQTCVVHATR